VPFKLYLIFKTPELHTVHVCLKLYFKL